MFAVPGKPSNRKVFRRMNDGSVFSGCLISAFVAPESDSANGGKTIYVLVVTITLGTFTVYPGQAL